MFFAQVGVPPLHKALAGKVIANWFAAAEFPSLGKLRISLFFPVPEMRVKTALHRPEIGLHRG